ncbi:PEGA domain-containing protein [Aggregicoccus sp. 17bor-14]|uniref:PEGA domain-containing protein n=1 Tax=Myxococcaceae TaxID=31 RepID=UPI00129CFE54|nr:MULTISPECIES: PEGA domain-containing protein [Myxococcaceae]MBF5042151.1 PEGA domain-containing protein [Simulacricoccus sp. 17bor-14]MRI87928.1 PEGA domain-containing protein [Aggregicoccus sp. 17bor-14]
MSHALLLSLLLLSAPGARPPRTPPARLQVAQAAFNRGEFEQALQSLDAAAAETRDERTLGRIHLLRGQCYAALRDSARSEEALARALEADPEAALDPERVDPALVQQLEDLRARTRGELRVRVSGRAGGRVTVDGRPVGNAPVRTSVPIGRHAVEVRSPDGRQRDSEQVLVRAGRTSEVSLSLPESAPEPAAVAPAQPLAPAPAAQSEPAPVPLSREAIHPVADVRLALDPFQIKEGPGIEVGGGVQTEHLRATLDARLYSDFGLTLRGAAIVPVTGRFSGYVSGELPVLFPGGDLAVGLGGAAGAEYAVNPWLSPFAELGARHFFTAPDGYDQNRLTLQFGARLRLP